MIIAVDFDGVIVTNAYPGIGYPLPYVREVMCLLFYCGHILVINTCRVGEYAKEARHTLDILGIPYHHFNKNHPQRIDEYGTESRKISADMYIDDKNLGGFPGWLAVYYEIGRR